MNRNIVIVLAMAIIIAVVIVIIVLLVTQQGGTAVDIPLGGGPLQPEAINAYTLGSKGALLAPETATVVGKIDVANTLREIQQDPMMSQLLSQSFSQMYTQTGIDISKINDAVFVSGYDEGSEVVVLVSGDFNEGLVASKIGSQTQSDFYNGVTLYRLSGSDTTPLGSLSGGDLVAGFLTENVLILGSIPKVKETIDRAKMGASTSFMSLPAMSQLNIKLGSYPTYVFIKMTSEIKEGLSNSISALGINAPAIQSIDALAIGAGQSDVKIVLFCSNIGATTQVKNLLDGMKSMALSSISSAESQGSLIPFGGTEMQAVQSMVENIRITQDGNFIIVYATIPASLNSQLMSMYSVMGVVGPQQGSVQFTT